MLYYLFEYLEKQFQFPGASLFGFLSFRAAAAVIVSLLISTIYGKRIIEFLRKKQVGETIRDLGLEGQVEKAGTPTMGAFDSSPQQSQMDPSERRQVLDQKTVVRNMKAMPSYLRSK